MERSAAAAALLLALVAIEPSLAADRCAYDKQAMLALDEDAFDQDLSGGGGGWRAIGNLPGCELAAAGLLSAYRAAHPASDIVLAWHEGQMRASAGQYAQAIPLLRAARKPPTEDAAGWNHYVDATVAFLRRNRAGLLAARDRLAAVPYRPVPGMPAPEHGYIEIPAAAGQPPMRMRWPPNIEAVEGLVACFDKPYVEAYGQACRAQSRQVRTGDPSAPTPPSRHAVTREPGEP
jgi:hypothetical protein